MSRVQVWRLFAYKNDDPDGRDDESRKVAEWQLQDMLGWAKARGFDTIMFTRIDETDEYRKYPAPKGIRHTASQLPDGPIANMSGC